MIEKIQKQHLEAIEKHFDKITASKAIWKSSNLCTKVTLQTIIDTLKYVKIQSYNIRQFKAELLLDSKIEELEQQLKELQ